MTRKLVSADELHAKWMKDAKYRMAYDDLDEEFDDDIELEPLSASSGAERNPGGASSSTSSS